MRHFIAALFALSLAGTTLEAQTPKPAADTSGASRFALGWNLYASPQLWPDIGAEDDYKFGVGFGGMIIFN